MLVTLVGTVSVSALLWLLMPKLVMKLGPVLNGELQSCAVSFATITPGKSEIQHSRICRKFVICNKSNEVHILFLAAVFCDYYNSPGECEWHYKPCGADCMKTCRNPSGNCSTLITALEGTFHRYFNMPSS